MISEAIGVAGAEAVLSILVIVKVALPEGMASSKSSSCGIEITPEETRKSASDKTIKSFKTESTSKIWDLVEGNSSRKNLPVLSD